VRALFQFLDFSVVVGANGAIDSGPQNVIGTNTDQLSLACEASGTDAAIEWLRDSTGVTTSPCQPLSSDYSTETGGTDTDCTLIVQGKSGPFTCFDGSTNAEAAVILISQ